MANADSGVTLSAKQQAAAGAASVAAAGGPSNTSLYNQDISTVQSDINSNNFTGAWNTALSSSGLFDKGQSYSEATGQATSDPLLAAMEGDVGALDPSKNWSAAQTSNFYSAFNAEGAYHGQDVSGQGGGVESLGKNPYGLWGSASAITSGADAKANSAQGGNTPDVSRFVGAHPTTSFLGKYGADIAALALTAVTFGAAAPLAGAMLGATTALDVGLAGAAIGTVGTAAIDAGFGKPLTAGSLAGGALSGLGASGALGGIGAALGNATGIGSTAGGALVGAGVGAAGSAVNHGNIGLGALAGGLGGAIRGSGVLGSAGSAVNSATGIPTGLATAGIGAGVGIGTNYALGSLAGNNTSGAAAPITGVRSASAPVATPMQGSSPSSGATAMGANPFGSTPLSTGAVGSGSTSSGATAMGANPFGVIGAAGAIGAGATMSNGSMGMGTNGNMATQSTDTSLAGTITGAIPGLLQAGAGTAGSLAAASAQSNADQNAITTQQNNLGNINNIWSNQQSLGQGADTALGSALGTNGQPANYSGFENMPGYQFAVNQGTQAIQRQAASMGNAYTPNTAVAVGKYVTGTASQDYNTYISQLMGAAGLGSTANTQLQTGNQNTANNISSLQQNIGQAQAAGYTGVANAAGSLFGANGAGTSLIGAAGKALSGGSGSSPMNYGGSNPNGTSGNGTSSDPYGANASQYNQTNVGSTGIDPSTGQSWGSEGVTTPTFDSGSLADPSSGMDLSGDSAWNSITDTGGDAGDDITSFLGDW
jgi:hypothetical protein